MDIFDKLNPQTTIITPNRRLTASLLVSYQNYQLAKKQLCWPTLDILPYQTWIQRIWQETSIKNMSTPCALISNHQEQIIWENIIKNSSHHDFLLQVSATAEIAKSAWATLKQWQINLDHPMLMMTEDSQVFQQWAEAFQSYCDSHHWIDANSIAAQVLDSIKNQSVKLPETIIFAGFTELSPIQQNLLKACEMSGACIQVMDNIYTSTKSSHKSFHIGLTDYETEITTMARWAKELLHHNNDTSLKIGCIIPDLETHRDRIEQIFSEIFSGADYNISAGKCLTNYPIIYAAMQILELRSDTIPIEKLSYLLRTPYLGEAEVELTKRAAFDSHLKNENVTTMKFDEMISFGIEKYCPNFAKRLAAFMENGKTQKNISRPNDFVEHFIEKLSALGWPGERSINSQEYQIVQRFLDLLNEYKTFDMFTDDITIEDALEHIHQLAKKTIFQPQSNEASVQILGLLEAANLPFDYAWVVGLDDSRWPPHAKPNPFIPHRLQKSLQMPHATAEKELQYSTKLTAQLKESTKYIIFSHALQSGDCDLRPSTLIVECSKLTLNDIQLSEFTTTAEIIYQSQCLDTIHDEQAPSVSDDEKLRGGVSIIKKQAACAFKAFAETRLHAKKIELPRMGLRPQDRGTITHKALELFWQKTQDQAGLMQYDEDELGIVIEDCVQQAIESKVKNISTQQRYFTLEAERLNNLLGNWLAIEKQRPPFRVIAEEQDCQITIGKITLNVRVDRIDQLENDDQLVIDYKTGKYNVVRYWFGDRPEEPQLPLYCLSGIDKIKAIAFAEIHPDKLNLTGVSQSQLEIDHIKPIIEINQQDPLHWDEQIKSWKIVFDKLADEYMQGNAAVAPKNLIETCQHCDLKPLCRIHETQAK